MGRVSNHGLQILLLPLNTLNERGKEGAIKLLIERKMRVFFVGFGRFHDISWRFGPMAFSWLNDFKKVIFLGKDGGAYGRIILSGLLPSTVSKFYGPLYFTVRQVTEIISTEQPCDLAYEFGDGLLGLSEFPEGFPIPANHPWPFNDHLVIYIRHAGPGVMIGQAWQEGSALEQVPKKFCGEILMVKDYSSSLQQ